MLTYSNDLRCKVLMAYLHREVSERMLVRRFAVSLGFFCPRFAQVLPRHRRYFAPKPSACGQTRKIAGVDGAILHDCVRQRPDAALNELCMNFVNASGQMINVARRGFGPTPRWVPPYEGNRACPRSTVGGGAGGARRLSVLLRRAAYSTVACARQSRRDTDVRRTLVPSKSSAPWGMRRPGVGGGSRIARLMSCLNGLITVVITAIAYT